MGILLICLALLPANECVYIADGDDSAFGRPVSRIFALSEEALSDVEYRASFHGQVQRHAQVRYGGESSIRVALVVDQIQPGEFHLYADRNRDRVIDESDLIDGTGRERTFMLDSVIAKDEQVMEYPRQVRFRLGIVGDRFSMGTTGYVEGSALRDGSPSPIRMVDGDVNGLFGDPRDRLWIDSNNDGNWNTLQEQFPFRPILVLQGRRWAVKADRSGSRFELSEVTGVGELKFTLSSLPEHAKVLEFTGMVYSEDGSAHSISSLNEALTLPVGRYTPQGVTVVIDNGQPEPWYFSFSRSATPGADDWYEVAADSSTTIDATGTMRLLTGARSQAAVGRGGAVLLQPRLLTEHGLLINMSCRSKSGGDVSRERFHNRANITLTQPDGKLVSTATSGFA